jgi:choline dehydrogenase-like flavoprotein
VGKTRLSVTAGVFVLALGGIDNARLLLCSRDENGMAIGNEHDLVGRYFADHLHVAIGVLTVPDGVPSLYRARENGDGAIRGVVALTEAAQQRLHAHGFAITMHDAGDPYDIFSIAQRTAGHRSVQALLGPIRKRHRPERLLHHLATATAHAPEVGRLVYRRVVRRSSSHVVLACRAEQAPNPESRVTLSAEVDRFGVPKARLDWRLSDADLGSIERSQAALASALEGSTLEMIPRDDGRGGGWATSISGGAHHIGTTRMHSDARYGVVDANCRVHGPSNVYVAGSSVFPTGGWAPPTLTIVALALRLADHLASSGSA